MLGDAANDLLPHALDQLYQAALDTRPISGLTHRFYRYPARFSPGFAAAAIRNFSAPGALVLDPYMGGATTIVEALALGRRAVGCDVNSLAVFIARAKTTVLMADERRAIKHWALKIVPSLRYSHTPDELASIICPRRTKNLTLSIARPLKKLMALALLTLDDALPSEDAKNFARCALLNVGQWALNGRRRATPLAEFRQQLSATVGEMLNGLRAFSSRLERHPTEPGPRVFLINDSAEHLRAHEPLQNQKVDLAVSSPPYPGIHMLYHRWQVDGRRETPAPYWLAACQDGQGASFYNFADRRDPGMETYFEASLRTLRSIREVMKDGSVFVQLIAFSEPGRHLPRYLRNMRNAGFQEVRHRDRGAIWRRVPSRRWHASLNAGNGAREIVLIHRAG